jgi:hypothetical protein
MGRAFDASKYDSYFQQRFNLDRDIARQRGNSNPLRFIVGVVGHPLLNFSNIRQYARLELTGATNPADLEQQAKRVITFGERMMAADTDLEEAVGHDIALDAYKKLQPVAASPDQAFIAARIAQLQTMRVGEGHSSLPSGIDAALVTNVAIIDICFLVILISFLILASSIGIRVAGSTLNLNLMSCAAICAVLLACAGAFVAYVPYAHLLAQAMDPQTPAKVSIRLLLTFLLFATPLKATYGVGTGQRIWLERYPRCSGLCGAIPFRATVSSVSSPPSCGKPIANCQPPITVSL